MARLRPLTSSFTLFVLLLRLLLTSASKSESKSSLTLKMDTTSVKAEGYYCSSIQVPDLTQYIIEYEPHFNAAHEHHILVFGCKDYKAEERWLCPHTGAVCKDSFPKMLYAWAKQADGLSLPQDVGFQIGKAAGVQSIVMQVHIRAPPPPQEPLPSLTFTITTTPQQYVVGIFLVGSSAYSLAPERDQIKLKSACFYQGPTMHPFAFRTHAHSHGIVISGYVIKDGKWNLIGQRSPQDPQAFYPATKGLTVRTGDMLAASCTFDTSNDHKEIKFGPNSNNEMCNFYIMYYYKAGSNTIKTSSSLDQYSCWDPAAAQLNFPSSAFYLPHSQHPTTETEANTTTETQPTTQTGANTTQAPTTLTGANTTTGAQPTTQTEAHTTEAPTTQTEAHTTATQPTVQTETHTTVTQPTTQTDASPTHPPPPPAPLSLSAIFAPAEDWPSTRVGVAGASVLGGVTLGQVSGVAVDTQGNVFVLHRASRVWDASSFSMDNRYQFIQDGAINDPVVLKVSPQGSLLATWGRRIFYMPHGLTIDSRNNLWITDTARHQVMRAPVFNTDKKDPPLVLGSAFTPGTKLNQFCKPAAVAVDEQNDVFYVADGYCNSRIMVFKFDGTYITQYASPVGGKVMHIPHSLALSQGGEHLFVADRINNRILQFDTRTKEGVVFCGAGQIEGALFAVSFARTRDGQKTWPLYAVNGSWLGARSVGYSINSTGNVVVTWSPHKGFNKPHDISASSDSSVYIAEIGPNLVWKMVPVPAGGNAVLPDILPAAGHDKTPTHHLPSQRPNEEDTNLSSPPSSPHSPDLPSQATDDYMCPIPPPPPSLGFKCITRTISSSVTTPLLSSSSTHPSLLLSSSSFLTTSPSSCQTSCVVYVTNSVAATSTRWSDSALHVIFVASMVVPVLLALTIFIGCFLYHRRSKARRKEVPQRTTRIALDTILGPARQGFHPVKNYDSDSGEEEEMFIFSKS